MLVVNNYGGLWAVDYISKAIGMTLFVSEDENRVWREFDKFSLMSEQQLKGYLLTI